MFCLNQLQTRWVSLGLVMLMGVTRFHHFGTLTMPPDASWAIFFLAGLYLSSFWMFPLLLFEAGLIDYLAISFAGTSDWCVTPAYLFLIPTYGALWFGGRWCRQFKGVDKTVLLSIAAALIVSTGLAFLISNGSFYLLSDRFHDLSWVEYSSRVVKYFPPYLLTTLLYTSVALVVHSVLHFFSGRAAGAVHIE